MSVSPSVKEALTRRIAGEIILSNEPGVTMKKWRELFGITQVHLAERLGVSPSVISDYESGRRRSPGTRFVRRFVEAIVQIDEMEGGHFLRELSRLTVTTTDAILDLREFPVPVEANEILIAVRGVALACRELLSRDIYGYTIIDSIKAIQTLSGTDFYQLFGSTTERALVFTNVTHGRSPMVAVRVHPLKPRMVVVHGPAEVDSLAILLAEVERIPLVLSKVDSEEELVQRMNELHQSVTSERMKGV
ncbi:MAG: helix-turn-helix domain-containing protein [Candidatus Bathyarchaeia archaeon]